MSAVMSSYAEIMRVGGWALRGAGYPFGTAERGVRLLAWTEAIGGEAIESLRLAEDAVARSNGAPRIERRGDASAGRIVTAHGRHLLEAGGPAADLATSDARVHSSGHIAVFDAIGFELVPAIANLLAQRRLAALLVHRAAATDRLPGFMHRAGWLSVSGASDRPSFRQGAMSANAAGLLTKAARQALSAPLAEAFASAAETCAVEKGSGVLGILAMPLDSSAAAVAAAARSLPDAQELDFAARFADALSQGFPIEAENLKYLYELEIRTWAPTSERSRGQAGYGVYQAG